MSGVSRSRSWGAVAIIAALATLVALRLLLIHYDMGRILYFEEPYRLLIATEIADGPKLPIAEYQADHYQGGSLAVGLLAAPLTALFGASFETLKLVPLLISLATVLLWCVLLWRASGPGTAALAAWLFALAPPMAQIYQVHAMGSHAESSLFTAAGFVLVQSIAAGASSLLLPFLLGMTGGLGLWFCYSAASGIAAWGLFWLLASPRGALRRGFVPLVAGGVLGLSPWLAYNWAHGFRGLDRLRELLDRSQPVITGSTETIGTRLAALIAVDLPRAMGFAETVPGVPEPQAWIYVGLLAFGVLGALVIGVASILRARRVDERWSAGEGGAGALIALAVAFHLTAYTVSSFRPDVEAGYIAYRFFYPLYPLAVAALAMTLARPRRAAFRFASAAAFALMAVLALGGTFDMFRSGEPTHQERVQSGYHVMGLLMQIKHHDRLPHAVAMLDRLEGQRREFAFFGYGWGLQFEYEKYGGWPYFVQGLALCPRAEDREAALQGASWAVRARMSSSLAQANAGFRTEFNRRLFVSLSEFSLRLNALPKPSA